MPSRRGLFLISRALWVLYPLQGTGTLMLVHLQIARKTGNVHPGLNQNLQKETHGLLAIWETQQIVVITHTSSIKLSNYAEKWKIGSSFFEKEIKFPGFLTFHLKTGDRVLTMPYHSIRHNFVTENHPKRIRNHMFFGRNIILKW